MNNISLRELEVLTTTRVVCNHFATHRKQYITKYRYLEALEQAMRALDEILVDRKLNKTFWARIRGKRLYLFYLPLNRIAIEAGIVTDKVDKEYHKNFELRFIGYKGKFPPKTTTELIDIIEKSNKKRERNNYDQNHLRQIKK